MQKVTFGHKFKNINLIGKDIQDLREQLKVLGCPTNEIENILKNSKKINIIED